MNKRVIVAVLALLAVLAMIAGMVLVALPASAETTGAAADETTTASETKTTATTARKTTTTTTRKKTTTTTAKPTAKKTAAAKTVAAKITVTTAAAVSAAVSETGTTAAADSTDSVKTYNITEKNGKGSIVAEPNTLCFWEYPQLPAGRQRQGTIQIVNKSNNTVDFSLSNIILPYSDEAALTYLTALHITVAGSNGTVYYDGLYSNIAGKDGLKLDFPALAPGKSEKLLVTLRCAFTYMDDPVRISDRITWKFQASASVGGHETTASVRRVLGIGALSLAGIGLVLIFIRIFWKKKSKRLP